MQLETSSATIHCGGEGEHLQIPAGPHLDSEHHTAGEEGSTAAVFSEEAQACWLRSSGISTAALPLLKKPNLDASVINHYSLCDAHRR